MARDVAWLAEEDVQAQYKDEFAGDDEDLLANALTNGDLELRATYKSASFAVSIDLMNLNADETDDPYYMQTITYVKN
ncbi:hypothetical protein D3C86_1580890 [compost metagenome]